MNRRIFAGALLGGTAAAQYLPKQSDRPEPIEGDEPGFVLISDRRGLGGWHGDPVYWRTENDSIIGEITPETIVKSNTFIVWEGSSPRDFELKLNYRITAGGNSGVNYRSARIPDPVTPSNKYALRGYQCDLDGKKRYTGNNYEEKGRRFLAVRGQVSHVTGTRKPVVLSTFGDPDALAEHISDGWNAVHIIARGPVMTHIINGQLMSVVIDDDAANRPLDGQIGVQVHVGPPMKVEYRNIRIKEW